MRKSGEFAPLVVYVALNQLPVLWGQPLPVSDVGGHEGPPAEEEETRGAGNAPVFILVCF